MKYLEILFWKLARYLVIKSYGANCEAESFDDFPEQKQWLVNRKYRMGNRCISCVAKDIVYWIDEHIELLKM